MAQAPGRSRDSMSSVRWTFPLVLSVAIGSFAAFLFPVLSRLVGRLSLTEGYLTNLDSLQAEKLRFGFASLAQYFIKRLPRSDILPLPAIGYSLRNLSSVLIPSRLIAISLRKWFYTRSLDARNRHRKRAAEAKGVFSPLPGAIEDDAKLALRSLSWTLLLSVSVFTVAPLRFSLPGVTGTIFIALLYHGIESLTRVVYHRYLETFWTREKSLPPLPTELWDIIIRTAMVPEMLDTTCDVQNLPYFLLHHHAQSRIPASCGSYRHHHSIAGRLRLVSPMWKEIVDKYAMQWQIQTDDTRLKAYPIHQARRLDLLQGEGGIKWISPVFKIKTQSPTEQHLSRLAILAVEDRSGVPPFIARRILSFFDQLSGSRESIRCLAYHVYNVAIPSDVLSTLSFSLTTLILEGNPPFTSLEFEFPHLRTLDLTTDLPTNLYWKCPRLRHYSFRTPNRLHIYDTSMLLTGIPLLDRLNDLEALILKDKILHVNHTFWSKFAKLQLLGCKGLKFQHQDSQLPLDDHPLRHLYIEEDEVYIGPPDLFERMFNRFPKEANEGAKTKTLYLPPPNHLFRASAYRDQWSQFYVASQQQGVTWKTIQPNIEVEDVWALLFPEGAIGLFERVVITAGDHGHLVFALVVTYGICYDVKTESIVSKYIYLFISLLLYGLLNR